MKTRSPGRSYYSHQFWYHATFLSSFFGGAIRAEVTGLAHVQKLCERFRKIEFRHITRIQNELAYALATIASMIKHLDTVYIDPLGKVLKEHPVHCSHVEAEPDGLPWYVDIKRRTPDLGLLRCVNDVEDAKLIKQIHAGVCGTHMNGLTLERKILRADWGIDVIGPIEPAASNGHRFILVDIDYFTKWVESAYYKSVTKKVVVDFVHNNMICRFGVPESIITNNGANINSHLMRVICEQFKITHRNSTAYHPQMNGAVETSIGATPYLLVYGTKAVIPAKVEIPSLRIIQKAEPSNVEWVSKITDQLTLIDEKRMVVVCHGQLYRQRMIQAFHKRVKAIIFEIGRLVLKHIFPHQEEYKGKYAPNWQGPYMVQKVLSGGALVLSEMDSTAWPKSINSDAITRYYL
ncbi:uncharacterized protein LOC107003763 [Solanum pennellii]|uniref:Uncharacterized protein LOC107003763 n=1 Tax=Solanum pennellii TaxID=28526 RepID=A0ABM1FIZ0_SOLPN|nr:uncharacterized protein LOC107003763 [Solanum pennellii]